MKPLSFRRLTGSSARKSSGLAVAALGLLLASSSMAPAMPAGIPFGRGNDVVDCKNLGSFLDKTQYRGAAIAHPLAGRLARAHHNGDLVLETHDDPPIEAAHVTSLGGNGSENEVELLRRDPVACFRDASVE